MVLLRDTAGAKRGAPATFLTGLQGILQGNWDDIVAWTSSGTSFVIKVSYGVDDLASVTSAICHHGGLVAWESLTLACPSLLKLLLQDMDRFTSEVLEAHFKHCKFSSFQRQLNLYGFHKVSSEDVSCSLQTSKLESAVYSIMQCSVVRLYRLPWSLILVDGNSLCLCVQIGRGIDCGAYSHEHFTRDAPDDVQVLSMQHRISSRRQLESSADMPWLGLSRCCHAENNTLEAATREQQREAQESRSGRGCWWCCWCCHCCCDRWRTLKTVSAASLLGYSIYNSTLHPACAEQVLLLLS